MKMAVNAKNWQELKKPNALEKKQSGGDSRRRAAFVAEPLERGFGMTLGNSLRRVLLSSLQGAAVTSIKMDGVLHEFSSLAGVREDAVDVAISVADTVIQANPKTNIIEAIPDRRQLRLGQTPQGFSYRTIKEAYDRALGDPKFTTTDDCGVVVKYMPETKVFVVAGDASNLKLTFQTDLMIIDKFMQS